ncbi:MAG: VOC family protein [Nocardiopsaceae bacterium]|nr:VOC family protein [Nocardiopsaceae bacterium]
MERVPHPYARGDLVVVVDCRDLDRAARFWADVLGYTAEGEAAGDTGGEVYRSLYPVDGRGIEILLQRTADAKASKNRLHLDLRTRNLEAEVGRVTALGATRLTDDPVREEGWAWHVLADPDGNEFCVVLPPDVYWTGQ